MGQKKSVYAVPPFKGIGLYDYLSEAPVLGRKKKNTRRCARLLKVADNLPKAIPVTETELAFYEVCFAEMLDEIFGSIT